MSSTINSYGFPPRARQRGVGILEVMIAILVLALGLLGLAGLQVRALKGNHSSVQRTQAVLLTYTILDAMRADKQSALTSGYNMPKTCTVPAGGSSLAANNKNSWLQALKDNLGNTATTCGLINCEASGNCYIQVWWDDSRANGSDLEMIETRTRL